MTRFKADHSSPIGGRVLADGGAQTGGGTVVGVATPAGVVLAADTRTSRGTVVASDSVRKLAEVHPTAAMGATDDLGSAQAFIKRIRMEVDTYERSRNEEMRLPALASFIAGELRLASEPATTFMLGGVDDDGSHLFVLDPTGGVLEERTAAAGSGQQIAYGVLDATATDSLALSEARTLVCRALKSAVERDVQTGVGILVAEITVTGVDLQQYDSVDELL